MHVLANARRQMLSCMHSRTTRACACQYISSTGLQTYTTRHTVNNHMTCALYPCTCPYALYAFEAGNACAPGEESTGHTLHDPLWAAARRGDSGKGFRVDMRVQEPCHSAAGLAGVGVAEGVEMQQQLHRAACGLSHELPSHHGELSCALGLRCCY